MTPAFQPGDWLVTVRGVRPRVGTAIVLRDPRDPERLMVKRVRGRRATGWWVEGDNPARSTDSRRFGPVPDDLVVAVVLVRYRPLIRVSGFGRLRDRFRKRNRGGSDVGQSRRSRGTCG